MKESIVRIKSYQFSIRIVKIYQYIQQEKKEFVLAKQVLRCGTSIGAMVREAEQAESTADFIHKLSVALKEANETEYWICLLNDTEYITETMFQSILSDCKEIMALITSIIKTTKAKKQS